MSIQYSQVKEIENFSVSGLKLNFKNVSETSVNGGNSQTIPVLVLLSIPATEARYEGPSSRLTKTLQELEKFRLMNRETQNLVIVTTNACSIPYKNVENWTKKIQEKCQGFQSHVESITGVRAPFAVLENAAEDYELSVTSQGTLLPDGVTEQPTNLLRVVAEQMKLQNVEFEKLSELRKLCKSVGDDDWVDVEATSDATVSQALLLVMILSKISISVARFPFENFVEL